MSGNNSSYTHWKPNVSLDIIAAGGGASGYGNVLKTSAPSQPISMATLTAIPSHGEYLVTHPSYAATLQRHHPHLHHQAPHLHQPQLLSPHSPSLAATHQIDVYSQLGMQRLGQMYKANVIQNNNNNNSNNNNHNSSNSSVASSTGSNAKAIADATNKETNANNVQQLVESAIGTEAKQQIMQILEKISMLQPPERLLLYMRMPSSTSETDPLRQPQNPLGTRSEINHTINWVRSHLEHDPNVSIPKQDVYEDYVGYCTREDIKPLSTADFGKVMKQIFPGIRPRRLGTRGNSRYCYAAMRKTTKLECPYLPNLNDAKNASSKFGKSASSGFASATTAGDGSEDADGLEAPSASWKIIKTWAEGLLSTEFHNVTEMADYISTNYMNGASAAISNSSRALLQKKLLQRKVKGRKKNSISTSADNVSGMKKRRKKKLKNSISVSVADDAVGDRESPLAVSPSVAAPTTPGKVIVPEEVLLIKQEQKSGPPEQHQLMPINLKTGDAAAAKIIKSEFTPMSPGQTYPHAVCKVELDEANMEVEQTFHCKKVKRAQESKGLSISVSTAPSQSSVVGSPIPKSSTQMSPSSVLMRPPTYHNHMQSRATDLSVNSADSTDIDANAGSGTNISGDNAANGSNKRGTSTGTPARTKKLRFLKHASVAGMNETKVDDITTDIIIPRERVISICNLDKDALDDYLNEGDNSQEQEAELLQYFQPNESEKPTTADATTAANATITTTTSKTTSTASTSVSSATLSSAVSAVASADTIPAPSGPYPLLENYQLYQQPGHVVQTHLAGGISAMQPRQRKQDQISELRQYLQQNLHQPHANDSLTGGGGGDVPAFANEVHAIPSSSTDNMQSHVIASPQHQTIGHIGSISVTSTGNHAAKRKLNEGVVQSQVQQPTQPQLMRSVSASATVGIAPLQSPNSRRKNFSFVPISPGPQSPRSFVHHSVNSVISGGSNLIIASNAPVSANIQAHSPFVSPRVTPAIRKPINKDLMSCLNSLQSDPLIGSYKTAFSKPNSARSDISASAPVSPSITPHHFNFQGSIMYGTGISSSNQSQMQQNPHQHQATCAVSGMCPILESRSQSVPLHCQSPAFNNTTDTTAYSSACNSIAQTPVPSEFADFSDENILNSLFIAESSAEQNIKLEVNDIPDLIETDLGTSMLNVRNHMNMSRSVPSTPLPMRGYGTHTLPPLNTCTGGSLTQVGGANSKADFDISKSVPTTPGRNCTPFRYSPEHHRDFLINGNTIETINKGNQFFPTTQPQSQPTTSQQLQQPNSHTTVSSTSSIPPNEMDDLSNYSDVNDPIIDGSDLLHNL